tara:strand:+ start:132 stop:413 length:282 start_codon:yes stop_codon:yes gene_type:complete
LSRPYLIKKLKEKFPDLNNLELQKILDTFNESIESALKNNKNVELRGFGTFFLKKIKEKYSARNPKTGETIYVPEKNKIRFRPTKKLKEVINK